MRHQSEDTARVILQASNGLSGAVHIARVKQRGVAGFNCSGNFVR
jgi:hypothetical protein